MASFGWQNHWIDTVNVKQIENTLESMRLQMNRSIGRSKANPIKIDAVMNANQHFFPLLRMSCSIINYMATTLKWHRNETIFLSFCLLDGVTFNRKALYSWKRFTSEYTFEWSDKHFVSSLALIEYVYIPFLRKIIRHEKHSDTWLFFIINCLFSLRVVIEKSGLFLFSFQQLFFSYVLTQNTSTWEIIFLILLFPTIQSKSSE